jgi:hypothetical protein
MTTGPPPAISRGREGRFADGRVALRIVPHQADEQTRAAANDVGS